MSILPRSKSSEQKHVTFALKTSRWATHHAAHLDIKNHHLLSTTDERNRAFKQAEQGDRDRV